MYINLQKRSVFRKKIVDGPQNLLDCLKSGNFRFFWNVLVDIWKAQLLLYFFFTYHWLYESFLLYYGTRKLCAIYSVYLLK